MIAIALSIVLVVALVWPFFRWKNKPLGMRVLASLGLFGSPLGMALILDGSPGGAIVLAAGIVSLIAVTYFEIRLRAI